MIQRYDEGGGVSKWLMIAALVYTVAPDLIPGPVDDGGVILLALAMVGIMSLFGGAK